MPISVFVLGRSSGPSFADSDNHPVRKKRDRQNHPGYASLFCKMSKTELSLVIQAVFEK